MPVDSVKVTQKKIEVTVKSTGQKLVVSSPQVQIVTAGKVGPPGPPGNGAIWITQAFNLENSQQDFGLNFQPRTGYVFVYLNGLLEHLWTYADMTVTLDDAALEGDIVTVIYQKET